jgi:hypothetical protein
MHCNPLKVNRRFGGTFRLHIRGRRISQAITAITHCFMLLSCLAYYSTLKMETCSSETSDDFQHTTWRYSPEDRSLHNYRCDNLKRSQLTLDMCRSCVPQNRRRVCRERRKRWAHWTNREQSGIASNTTVGGETQKLRSEFTGHARQILPWQRAGHWFSTFTPK